MSRGYWKTYSGHVLTFDQMETTHIWNAVRMLQRDIDVDVFAPHRCTGYGCGQCAHFKRKKQTIKDFHAELVRRGESIRPDARLDERNQQYITERYNAFDEAWRLMKAGFVAINLERCSLVHRTSNYRTGMKLTPQVIAAWMAMHNDGRYEKHLPPNLIKKEPNRHAR